MSVTLITDNSDNKKRHSCFLTDVISIEAICFRAGLRSFVNNGWFVEQSLVEPSPYRAPTGWPGKPHFHPSPHSYTRQFSGSTANVRGARVRSAVNSMLCDSYSSHGELMLCTDERRRKLYSFRFSLHVYRRSFLPAVTKSVET